MASATARVTGVPEALTVAATLGIDGVAAAGLAVERIESRVDATLQRTSVSARSRTTLTGLSASDPALAALPPRLEASLDATVDLAAQTVALSGLKIVGDGVDVAGSGRVDLVGGDLAIDATATLDRLAPVAAIVGLDLAGRAGLTVALTGGGFGERAAGTLSLQLDELDSGDVPLAPLVGRAATLTATIAAASADGIEVSDFALDSANLKMQGKLAIRDAWQAIDLTATLADHALAPWRDVAGVALDGRLRGTIDVTGAVADPTAHAAIDLDGVTVEGVGPLAGRIVADAADLAGAPAGTVATKLSGPGGPLTFDARFAMRQPNRLALDAIRLTAAKTTVTGGLTLDLATGLATGDLDLAATDLAGLGALAGVPLRGAANGRLSLAGEGGDQTGTLKLTAPSLTLAQPEGDDIAVADLALTATLNGLTPRPKGKATLTVGSVRTGDIALDRLSLTGAGTLAALTFDIAAGGTVPAPVSLAAGGTAAAGDDGWTITVERLTGDAAGQAIALQAPATVTLGADRLAVTPFALTLGDGRASGEANLDGQRVAARFDIAALPLKLLTAFADGAPLLGGTLSLQAAVDGASTRPNGTLAVQLDGVTARDVPLTDAVALNGSATATLAGERLALHAEIGGFAERGLVLDGALPLRLSLQPFAASLPPDGAIEGALAWQGQVSTLWEALPFDTHRLAGIADLSGTASGTVAAPSITARLRVTEGRYENLELGTVLDALDMTAAVDAGRTLTVDLSGTDGGAGTISGKGSVALLPLENFPIDVALDFAAVSLVRRDDITLAANGALKLAGDATAMTLGGTIETTRIEARLDTGLPPSVVDLEVVDSKAQATAEAKAEREKTASALTLDLDITVPGQAFVRGRGLDSEWRGALRVTGDAAAPAIAGTLAFVRGQFSFAGKRFALDDSTIVFDGSTEVDPLLDIRAAHATGDVTALILITGRASDPKIALSSTPPLPQDEVLSRVLFGKGAGSLSPLEGLQLAAAVAQLSGQGPSGAGILDQLRATLGVDVLEVGASDDGTGASLRAGRYINDRTFVGVTQGTQPGSTGVTVEIELLPNIVLDSEVDQAGTSKSGIKWKWDY
jgi:translocation and assembly module TamB